MGKPGYDPADTNRSSPYTPIDSRQGEIRLLEIDPGDYDDDINISLTCVQLAKKPVYIALSYVWGDTQSSRTCTLDGVPMPINESLDRALRHFRDESIFLILWVDALCINQADLEERAAQVQLMRHIYEGADSIFAWLGEPRNVENVQAGIEMLNALCDQASGDLELLAGLKMGDTGAVDNLAKISEYDAYFPFATDTDIWKAWEGITEMFTCEYWNRLWILQEAATPTNIQFYFGNWHFGMRAIAIMTIWASTYRMVPEFPPQFARFCHSDSYVARIIELGNQRELYANSSLYRLMQYMRGSMCTDALDRIYAPLGLADDILADSILVDYNSNVDELYLDVARVLITQSATSLATLGAVYTPTEGHSLLMPGSDSLLAMPSWVPDWRQDYIVGGFSETINVDSDQKLYDPLPGTVSAHINGTRLSVKGYVMHKVGITIMTSIWDDPEKSWSTPISWYRHLNQKLGTSVDLDLAIRRSYVGDKSGRSERNVEDGYKTTWHRGGTLDLSLFETAIDLVSQASLVQLERAYMLLTSVCYTRRMAILSNSQVAVLPAAAKIGDKIAAFRGGHALYLLRALQDRDEYQFIGECYVDGWMDGELVEEMGEERLETITMI